MLHVYVSISDISKGFPQVVGQHLLQCRQIGNLEEALNTCIDDFDAYADRRPEESLFRVHKDAVLTEMAAIQTIDDFRSRLFDHKLLIITCKDI